MSTGKSSTQTGSAPVVSGSQLQNIANQQQLYQQAQQGLGSTLGATTNLYNQSAVAHTQLLCECIGYL